MINRPFGGITLLTMMTEEQARTRLQGANIPEMEQEFGISRKTLYGWRGGSRKISHYTLAFLSEYFKRKDQEQEHREQLAKAVEKERKLWERYCKNMLDWRLRYFQVKPEADNMAVYMNEPNKPHYVTANND